MNAIVTTHAPSDSLVTLTSAIMHDGATLLGWNDGAYAIMLFGVLLPAAAVLLLCSASLALSRHKASRIVAIVCLTLGCIALAAFIAMAAYAVIFGTTWAKA
ncbi:MAG: hypothetical protein NC406_00520 [Bacteroides sp.]|nr:hypothetical protein [Bacteroides sp.]MCM1094774.1 hypothetical protein [Terasakiella sp.]